MKIMLCHNSAVRKPWILGILSWLIPGGIFLLSMALIGAAPFGDETILLRDSVGQYLDFINYFKTVLRGENDLFYTFSKTLGGDLLSLASYYLLSPFNLLFIFSTNENIPLFYTAVVVLKLSACGGAFCWAALKREDAKYSHLLFSTAYALMSYNILYQWNIMWLDGVMILPLLGLGIERIWERKSPVLYIFSLGYALVTNFYIGYMLCVASVLFSFARFLLYKGNLRERCGLLRKYLFASCVGGLGTAFVWLPSFLSLRKGRPQFDESIFSFVLNFDPPELTAKLVAGAGGPEQLGNGLPHIFCGTLTLFLVFLFFFSKKVPWKVRITVLCTVLTITGSFFFRFTDVAWHGFSPNNSFNFRYAFILSYLLIMIAQHTLSKKIPISFLGSLAAAIPLGVIYIFLLTKDYDYVQPVGIGLGTCVVTVFLIFGNRLGGKKLAYLLLCAVSIVELGVNSFLLLDGVVGEVWTLRMSEWNSQIPKITQAVDYVKQQDTSFYRMEKTFQRTHNDAMFFAYNGLSHFSSAERAFVPEFTEKMGLRNHLEAWTYYNAGSTAEVDSLLGIKYVLSKADLTHQKGYTLLTKIEDIGVYQNHNALPIAMLADPQIVEVSMDRDNYFALHNEIWSSICGEELQVVNRADHDSVTFVNLKESIDAAGNTVYSKINSTQEAICRYEITITQHKPLYFYFSAPDTQNVTVRVNGEDQGVYFDVYRWDMSSAGTYQPGDSVVIELVPGTDTMTVNESYFYYEDLQALTMASQSIQDNHVVVQSQSSSHLTGEITSRQDGYLLFTIPYDQGWQLCIDGNPVQTVKGLDTFLAAQITAGTHRFTLHYTPDGLYIGCVLSLITMTVALVRTLHRRRSLASGDHSIPICSTASATDSTE
ncbi:MAG: YfhO family protein [Oscillospiraceae bacterium]|nr:YfhO family protein [Oscillospiraceae bacterium]